MEAKEKAEELINKFVALDNDIFCSVNYPYSKQCAKIAVNEIIKANPIQPLSFMLESEAIDAAIEYWNEVLKEIDNI